MAATDRSAPQNATNLSAFQRDLLYVIADVGPTHGLGIKDELSDYYATEINHGRLYPNLDTLVDMGLVEKSQADRRTNSYELTERGTDLLAQRREWERERASEVSA
ncbi:PadR family transcriptional regulator [Natrinema thermotolerans]|uniref:PadR family transcriptional regulator n=1 Tax=Natrinema thermotolerans TaxID=121872 RepID=UPI000678FB82|nr:PadR family transcriptional regulator [Natrinema thermotolerans]QCC57254.1 PadR family transcriptional regulator [Natrinema thermotolerans]